MGEPRRVLATEIDAIAKCNLETFASFRSPRNHEAGTCESGWTSHYSNPDWPTDPTHRNHFNSYSFNCFTPDRTPFPFYTTVELRPLRTYVSLANIWRFLVLEFVTNLDQHWPALRFKRKFWEFYLSTIFRGKELRFEFEVVK